MKVLRRGDYGTGASSQNIMEILPSWKDNHLNSKQTDFMWKFINIRGMVYSPHIQNSHMRKNMRMHTENGEL